MTERSNFLNGGVGAAINGALLASGIAIRGAGSSHSLYIYERMRIRVLLDHNFYISIANGALLCSLAVSLAGRGSLYSDLANQLMAERLFIMSREGRTANRAFARLGAGLRAGCRSGRHDFRRLMLAGIRISLASFHVNDHRIKFQLAGAIRPDRGNGHSVGDDSRIRIIIAVRQRNQNHTAVIVQHELIEHAGNRAAGEILSKLCVHRERIAAEFIVIRSIPSVRIRFFVIAKQERAVKVVLLRIKSGCVHSVSKAGKVRNYAIVYGLRHFSVAAVQRSLMILVKRSRERIAVFTGVKNRIGIDKLQAIRTGAKRAAACGTSRVPPCMKHSGLEVFLADIYVDLHISSRLPILYASFCVIKYNAVFVRKEKRGHQCVVSRKLNGVIRLEADRIHHFSCTIVEYVGQRHGVLFVATGFICIQFAGRNAGQSEIIGPGNLGFSPLKRSKLRTVDLIIPGSDYDQRRICREEINRSGNIIRIVGLNNARANADISFRVDNNRDGVLVLRYTCGINIGIRADLVGLRAVVAVNKTASDRIIRNSVLYSTEAVQTVFLADKREDAALAKRRFCSSIVLILDSIVRANHFYKRSIGAEVAVSIPLFLISVIGHVETTKGSKLPLAGLNVENCDLNIVVAVQNQAVNLGEILNLNIEQICKNVVVHRYDSEIVSCAAGLLARVGLEVDNAAVSLDVLHIVLAALKCSNDVFCTIIVIAEVIRIVKRALDTGRLGSAVDLQGFLRRAGTAQSASLERTAVHRDSQNVVYAVVRIEHKVAGLNILARKRNALRLFAVGLGYRSRVLVYNLGGIQQNFNEVAFLTVQVDNGT